MQNKKIIAVMIIGLSVGLIGDAVLTMDRWETMAQVKGMSIPPRSGSWTAPSPAAAFATLRERSYTDPTGLAAAAAPLQAEGERLFAQRMSASKKVVGSPVLGLAALVPESSWETSEGFFNLLDGIFDDDYSAFISDSAKAVITRLWAIPLGIEIKASNADGQATVTREEKIPAAWVYCYAKGLLKELKAGVELATQTLADTCGTQSLSVSYKSYSITTADYAPFLERNRRFVAFLDAKIAFLKHSFKTEEDAEEALERLVGDDEIGAAMTSGAAGDLEWDD